MTKIASYIRRVFKTVDLDVAVHTHRTTTRKLACYASKGEQKQSELPFAPFRRCRFAQWQRCEALRIGSVLLE